LFLDNFLGEKIGSTFANKVSVLNAIIKYTQPIATDERLDLFLEDNDVNSGTVHSHRF
jgi:hypothetical protein